MAMEIVRRFPRSKESKFKASKGWMHKFLRRHPDINSLLSLQTSNNWTIFVEGDKRMEMSQ